MTEYACPKCNKAIILMEVNSKNFKYKVVCFHCRFYDWVDTLEELKEIKEDGKHT